MRSNFLKGTLKTAVFAVTILLFGVGMSFGQATVSLTAGAAQVVTPDGNTVPMWGYTCGATSTGVSCSNLDTLPKAGTTWSPVVITVPYSGTSTSLTINLTNSLSFTAGTGTNTVPTSLVIVGQLGGGLGTPGNYTNPPDHSNAQAVTWPIAGTPPGATPVGVGTPPTQQPRVQSFGMEVPAGSTLPLTWSSLKPGTYLIESGTHPSIQGPMGLYGILVVTTAPNGTTAGTAYPNVSYNADVPLLFSEIDPVQNAAVQAAVTTVGFKEDMVWSGQPGMCGNPSSATYHQCYPPAVNYIPLYYLINGVAFDKTNSGASLFNVSMGASSATSVTGNVLVRMVNAGLRMHVPSIVGSQLGTAATPPSGFGLIAEDGNPLPGVTRLQSEVFMPAGKTYDVMINAPAAGSNALPVFDRELSLSGNAIGRDAGMLAYISVNGSSIPTGIASLTGATARADSYTLVSGQTLSISDPGKGVLANDTNVFGVQLDAAHLPNAASTLTLNRDGTFTYVPGAGVASDTFGYCGNGATTGTACAMVSLGACTGTCLEANGNITMGNTSFTSNVATHLSIAPPGILVADSDKDGHPLIVAPGTVSALTGTGTGTVTVDPNGGFNANVSAPGTYTFTYKAQNSQGTVSATSATVTVIFPAGSGLTVSVVDGKTGTPITDYRWVIEEDRTFYIDPKCTTNPPPAGCPTSASGIVPTFGTNFHTSYMPLVATGCVGQNGSAVACESGQTMFDAAPPCTSPGVPAGCSATSGQHIPVVCDVGNGVCRPGVEQTIVDPANVALDATKHYYISVLPGDAGNPFIAVNLAACPPTTDASYDPTKCGHGMGGAPIAPGQKAVTILSQPSPYPPSKLSVFVFEDDFPLNGEQDGGGGIDVLSPNEGGLGGFNITLFDDAGGSGDATGQMTYDMFNQPLVNSLAGTPDPANSNIDACPVTVNSRQGVGDPNQTGITGTIVTCPKYEADGVTLSPLAGQAVVANLMPGRYGVVATPAADRIGRGEEWLQTNTLDGQKAHDSFLRIGEPSFFQEFGPAGYHVSIGFANPAIINGRKATVCSGLDPTLLGTGGCTNSIHGTVTMERMSRTPDERLYSSGDNSSFAFTQCYVSFGDPDAEDFSFTKCDANGNFSMSGLPDGDWRVTVFDQWNDMLVDGLSTPVRLGGGANVDMGQIAMNQWQANIYTKTFIDANYDGVQDGAAGTEPGLTLVATNIRFRDGSYSNFNNTDLAGNAGFNEIFPLFSWYVIETDTTRYKSTGMHVVYDAGGPADGTPCGTSTTPPTAPCGNSSIAANLANTAEQVSVPVNLRVPGARYCASADCPAGDSVPDLSQPLSTGRVDPPFWFGSEGWQGFSGQNSFVEFGRHPFAVGETGGIHGEVIYASTRPFDDPGLLIHTSWTPDVPGVTINLYQEGTAPDGTVSLHLVDTTKTSSWDDWAQGFRTDHIPNMNCPGQATTDLFYFSLFNQPMWLDEYNHVLHGTGGTTAMPSSAQFKCYDGMHNWNQVQPAPYDGMYAFPSIVTYSPTTGKPATSNCHMQSAGEPWGCVANPDATDTYRVGTPMLPAGKYVVEMIVPPGYELVKEEDKNILIGDNYIAPVTQEFPGLGSAIYILPDQAEVGSLYNATNPQNPTQTMGRTTLPSHEGDTGSVETFWPCVGAKRVVPDYISLFPQSHEVSPFAGAVRNLCDRKEVQLDDQTAALAKFWIFTSAHVAAHFTGVITDDFTSEFDPYSPQFGEKFSPPNLPISVKDWSGTEISRVYADHWGSYDGLTYSTWEVNPPNPTGYAPTMMVTCMNDPGPIPDPAHAGQMMTDPLYNPQYSQFCYEIPFMPGQTQYMDTPVVPTSAFAGAGYNNPDCAYPGGTPTAPGVPAIKEVDGDGIGPWVGVGKNSIASITLLTSGSSYNTAPASFNIPGGTTAATGQITDLKLISIASFTCTGNGTNRCSNFATHPTVTITGGGGSGATATATKSGTTISFVVNAGGSGYTGRPTVRIARLSGGTTSLSNSSASMGVNGIALTGDGAGYAGNIASFTISGGGGSNATASAAVGTSAQQITITALGDVQVPNNAYSGPQQNAIPYNQKTVTRHYGFGNTKGSVTIGGVNVPAASITTWNDTTIVLTVPAGVPACAVQQQAQYQGSFAECGQLFIKAANGSKSIDTVTVTIGGKAPTHVAANASIQSAIDKAHPGDLIIIDPNCAVGAVSSACTTSTGASGLPTGGTATTAAHNELLLMWKPVRLQGVGAASSVINANTHPAGKLDTWRREVNCLFGLAIDGQPYTSGTNPVVGTGNSNPYDSSGNFSCPMAGWNDFKGAPNAPQVDRLPLEAAVGWDATQNGNLAELLQEPTLMGALEGAGITVLAKGLNFNGLNPWTDGNEAGGFPPGTQLLQNVGGAAPSIDHCHDNPNPYPSNFMCNPSSIDGLTVTDSSQGGGGIYVHGWAHNLQLANNRINSNSGTLSGGINVGQGEFPGAYIFGSGTNAAPDSCQQTGLQANQQQPYCFDLNVNMHHNSITSNSSTGDELFSATPAGAGGVSICNGSDYYKFNNNWVCGNLSTGDGGGVAHIGYSWNGDIENNMFLFNQSTNPTIPTNGGGLLVMGAPDVDPACGATTDQDCVSAPSTITPSDGTGPGMVINANLFLGNSADSGSGGGLRFQAVNGTDVITFPTTPSMWYSVNVTNNIIANNVAGWDGAGISLQDALAVNIINNTIVSNDTTASSGVLFNTLGAPLASSSGPTCTSNCGTTSLPQPAGLVSIQNSAVLAANLPATVTCPAGHFAGGSATNANCRSFSYPKLENDVFWQNRSFYIGVGSLGAGTLNQQNVVSLKNAFTGTSAPSQPQADATSPNGGGVIVTGGTGACTPGVSYWDLGVRGDTAPANHTGSSNAGRLAPSYSIISTIGGTGDYAVAALHNSSGNPTFLSQYCNGSRVPPELASMGYQVPPGISDAQVPNPVFNLTPAATIDEGNNWINMSWGPLSMFQPVNGKVLGNYSPAAGSSVINLVPNGTQNYSDAPSQDFFGSNRKNGSVDAGAVEFAAGGGGGGGGNVTFTPTTWTPTATRGVGAGIFCLGFNVGPCQIFTLTNNSGAGLTGVTIGLSGTNASDYSIVPLLSSCGFSTTLGNGNSCTVTVQFLPKSTDTAGTKTATVSVTDSAGTQSAAITGTAR